MSIGASTGGNPVAVRVLTADARRLHSLLLETDRAIRWDANGLRREVPTAMAEALSLVSRSRSIYSSARVLLELARANEAMMLARALFTDALRLEYLARSGPEAREAVFLARNFAAIADTENKFHRLHRELGKAGLGNEDLATLATRRADIERRAKRLNVTPRDYPNEKALALRYGYKEDYWLFAISHDYVHGSALVQTLRQKAQAGNVLDIFEVIDDPEYACGVGVFAMKSALRAGLHGASLVGADITRCAEVLAGVIEFETELDGHAKTGAP